MPPSGAMSRFSYVPTAEPNQSACLIKVWISAVSTKKNTTFYTITAKSVLGGETWKVHRRYSEFLNLRDRLLLHFEQAKTNCPGCVHFHSALEKFEFPRKHMFSSRSQVVIRYRAKALRTFIRLITSRTFNNSPKCPTCGDIPFQTAKAFLLRDAEVCHGSNSTVDNIRQSIVVERMGARKVDTSATFDFSYLTSSSTSTSRVNVLEISEPATSGTNSDPSRSSVSPSKRKRNGKQRHVEMDDETEEINLDFAKSLRVEASSPRHSIRASTATADLNNLWQPWEMARPE